MKINVNAVSKCVKETCQQNAASTQPFPFLRPAKYWPDDVLLGDQSADVTFSAQTLQSFQAGTAIGTSENLFNSNPPAQRLSPSQMTRIGSSI